MFDTDDTIVALATPAGRGALDVDEQAQPGQVAAPDAVDVGAGKAGERQDQGKRQHRAVDRDLVQAWQPPRCEGHEQPQCRVRQDQTEPHAEQRQHEGLEQLLAGDPVLTGAQSGANSQLVLAAFGSHQMHEITMYYPMRMVRTRDHKLILNLAHPLEYPHASDLWGSDTWQGVLKRGDKLRGEIAFTLYDTYGFPLDLTQDALRPRGIDVDLDAFNAAMERQRAKARAAWAGFLQAAREIATDGTFTALSSAFPFAEINGSFPR